MAHKLISKAEAIKQGLTTYHTGKVCSKGHDAPRYTNSDKCIECHKERNARRDWSKTGKAKAEPKKKPVHWQQRIHPDVAYERDIRQVKTNTILEGLTPPGADYSKRLPYPGSSTTPDWQLYATKINATWQDAWQKAVPGILETGALLNEAKSRVSHGAWGKLLQKLPFSERMAQMLMAIAHNPVLSNPKHVSYLPPRWGTLHALTQVSDEVLLARIEDGTVNPKMERKEVALLLGPARQTKRSTKPSPGETYAALAQENENQRAHIADLEATREMQGVVIGAADGDAELADKILKCIGLERVPSLIEELEKLIQMALNH